MANCKACGAWFSSTAPDELCPTCGRALKRLNGYAVPVVRCKDCKCWDKKDNIFSGCRCVNWKGIWDYTKPEDFCSYGERREGE